MSQRTIQLQYVDQVHVRVAFSDVALLHEFSEAFTFEVPNAKYTPQFKARRWDGKIRLFNSVSQKIYYGLIPHIFQFCEENSIQFTLDQNLASRIYDKTPETIEETNEQTASFLSSLSLHCNGDEISPREHQVAACNVAFINSRALILSPTGSGKSLMIYGMIRRFLDIPTRTKSQKILVIVPTVSLVTQLFKDFHNYSNESELWNVEKNCHMIYSGEEKDTEKPVIISTWQSLFKMPESYFAKFDTVICDECHTAKAESIKTILEACRNATRRVGLTGTLDGMQTNKLVVEGLLGPAIQVATTKDLMDRNLLSKLKIVCNVLNYDKRDCTACKGVEYSEEIEYAVLHAKRNAHIVDYTENLEGNILILYQFVEKHGEVLKKMLEDKYKGTNRKIHFVSGDIKPEDREPIRAIVEKAEGDIIVASYGTYQMGININRLHHVIFASPSKSKVRVLQSIGRQLRLATDKGTAILHDFADNFSIDIKKPSHLMRHFLERIKIYAAEKFEFEIHYTAL